jgi:hypothetical protein
MSTPSPSSFSMISVRAMASSPSLESRKPPPTTIHSVLAQALVLRNRRVTCASSWANSSIALCTTAEASVSSPIRIESSVFLLMFSDGSLPNGSSPDLRDGLRQRSRILRNAPLEARSPRKPSSSLSSILKLSTSTDGSRAAPCRAMPVVVMTSSAICPCPSGVGRQRPRELFVSKGECGRSHCPLPGPHCGFGPDSLSFPCQMPPNPSNSSRFP